MDVFAEAHGSNPYWDWLNGGNNYSGLVGGVPETANTLFDHYRQRVLDGGIDDSPDVVGNYAANVPSGSHAPAQSGSTSVPVPTTAQPAPSSNLLWGALIVVGLILATR